MICLHREMPVTDQAGTRIGELPPCTTHRPMGVFGGWVLEGEGVVHPGTMKVGGRSPMRGLACHVCPRHDTCTSGTLLPSSRPYRGGPSLMGVWGVDRILEGLLALLAFLECARLEGFASRALWWLTALRAHGASASQKDL